MFYFSKTNKKTANLIFLHGWGGCWQSWLPILERLKKDFNLYAPDLPGFGDENIDKPYDLKDYTNFVLNFIKKNKIKNPILIGHSFGGAIASNIAANNLVPLKKIILVDAAPIRHPYTQSQQIQFRLLGIFKKIFPFTKPIYYRLTKQLDSDYAVLNHNPILQQTFKNVIQQDLSPILSKIKIPTLIIWGENDLDTPLSDGQKINSLIHNSQIIIYPNSGHFSYLDNQDKFTADIKKFIQK